MTQVGALQWKDLGGTTSTNASTVSGVASGAYTVTQDVELSSTGCNQGNPPAAICFTFNPLVAASDDMLFTFNLVGDMIVIDDATGPHLKVNFMDAWTQMANPCIPEYLQFVVVVVVLLSSSSAGGEGSSSSSGTTVPEPSSSLVLLGLGLLGLGVMRRMKQTA